eukprot:7045782-Pyramimonas_sp.AAC.3
MGLFGSRCPYYERRLQVVVIDVLLVVIDVPLVVIDVRLVVIDARFLARNFRETLCEELSLTL